MADFYTSEKELCNINSELLEPTTAALFGHWFARCEGARKVKEQIQKTCKAERREKTFHEHLDCEKFWDECSNFWFGIKGLIKVSIACGDAVHFSVALSNEQSKVSDYIEKYLGFNPILDKKGFGF